MNRSLSDVGGEVARGPAVHALRQTSRRGRRPSWDGAAPPEIAADRVEAFARALEARGATVRRGAFREHMEVELVNDGPVTLWIDCDRAPTALTSPSRTWRAVGTPDRPPSPIR